MIYNSDELYDVTAVESNWVFGTLMNLKMNQCGFIFAAAIMQQCFIKCCPLQTSLSRTSKRAWYRRDFVRCLSSVFLGQTEKRLEFSGQYRSTFSGASDVLLHVGGTFVLTWNQYCSLWVRSIQIQNQQHRETSRWKCGIIPNHFGLCTSCLGRLSSL